MISYLISKLPKSMTPKWGILIPMVRTEKFSNDLVVLGVILLYQRLDRIKSKSNSMTGYTSS